jgi:hypothetical protein
METDTREKEGYHIELTTRARRILQKRMEIYLVASDYPIARNIFTCTSGYFGIGPAGRNGIKACAIQRGDCVAIVPGVQTPMILRPRKDWLYPLVGKAYVAGIEGAPLASKKAACQIWYQFRSSHLGHKLRSHGVLLQTIPSQTMGASVQVLCRHPAFGRRRTWIKSISSISSTEV